MLQETPFRLFEVLSRTEDMLWRYSQDLKFGFRSQLKIEERLIDSKKFRSLFIFDAKTSLDLCKYFPCLKISFGSTPKGLKIGFGSQPKGWIVC